MRAHQTGGSRIRAANEDHATASAVKEMRCDCVPGAGVVDPNQIVTAALGIGDKVAVEKNEGDAGLVEAFGNRPVDSVLPWSQFQRGKEDPGNFSGNELPAGLCSLLLDIGRVAQRTSPKQNVLTAILRLRHPAANRFKNFRPAELRDQQPERIAIYPRVCAHVAAGTGAPLDDSRQLQFA